MRIPSLLIGLTALVAASSASAQMTDLAVGKSAPGLDVAKWVKGEETVIEEGTVYIIDFWATWCKPCVAKIPHMTELQREYADQNLRVIAVSTEDESTVSNFVRAQGSKMDYTVVVDNNSATDRAWMKAANRNTIPSVFIVDRQGKVQFIGSPYDEDFDTIVSLVVRGRYDARLMKEASQHIKAAESARKIKNWRLADQHYDDIVKLDDHVFAQLMLEKFEMRLIDQADPKAAYAFANKLIEERGGADPEFMGWLALKIATDPKISKEDRNFEVAVKAAQAALEFARPDDPAPRAVMASVLYQNGDVERAVALQTEAWMIAPPKRKPEYKRVLETYQRGATRASTRMSIN